VASQEPGRKSEAACRDYNFIKDDLKRSMMIVEESILNFYAGTSVPYERKMGMTT